MSTRRALITGVNGQDGSHLADILLERGWEVHGLHRHSSVPNHLQRIEHVRDRITLHEGDVTDASSLRSIINDVFPHVIFHEADQDHVNHSYKVPSCSVRVTVEGTLNLLECVRTNKTLRGVTGVKIFLPCSATMFRPSAERLSIGSDIYPMSPYACAKAHVFHLGRMYREKHEMHVVNGVLFSHDSVRRGPSYFLQRVARAAVQRNKLTITDPESPIDVGCAREFMHCAVLAMEHESPGDWIIGTGCPIPALQVALAAFLRARQPTALIDVVRTGAHPAVGLIADPSVTKKDLGWNPTKDARDVVRDLVDHFQEKGIGS